MVGCRMGRSLSVMGIDQARAIVGLTGVRYICDIARVSIVHMVGHSLGAAIGQENSVRSTRSITIALLVLAKVGAAVLVMHTILKGVVGRHGLFLVLGLRMSVACRMCLMRCRVVWGMVIGEGRGKGGSNKEESSGDDRCLEKGAVKHYFCTTKA